MPGGAYITVDDREAQKALRELNAAAVEAGATRVRVGSDLVYARRQEFEHKTKSGYLRGSLDEVRPQIKRDLAAAFPRGPQAVGQALLRLGYQVQHLAFQRAPVLTSALRRSLHTVASRR